LITPFQHLAEGYRMPIRVLIADDHAIVRLGVRKLIELLGDGEIIVVGEVADGGGLLDEVAAKSPDVLLLDIVMPGLDAVAHARQLTALPDSPRVLILTNHDGDDYILPLLAAGISGYLLKDEIPDAIVQAIRAVAEGGTWFSQRIAGQIARSTFMPMPEAEPIGGAPTLTPREWEILQHLAQGESNSDIADQLSLSKATVQNYVSNIYAKLGIETRAEAMLYAMRNKLVDIKDVLDET
jgi:two-component system, NarL family, response regulator DegU